MSYSRTRFLFCTTLVVITASLLCAIAIAGDHSRGKAQKVHASFVVADAYGNLVGPVLRYWHGFGITAQVTVDGIDTLAYLDRWSGFGMSYPHGPMLFFAGENCTGQAYARIEHVDRGWMSPWVVIVPGMVPEGDPPSAERIPYFIDSPEPGQFIALSHLVPEGYCMPFEPPAIDVWPVRPIRACKMSHDLNTCYPPPYELDLR